MKKRILIVSYFFAPQNAIGAVRPTKLAKYFTRMGYAVTVACGQSLSALCDPLLQRDLAELADVRFIRERSLLRWWKEREMAREAARASDSRVPLAGQGGEPPRPTAAPPATPKARAGATQNGAAHKLVDALYRWLIFRADKAFARACYAALARKGEHFDVVISSYGPASVHTVARRLKQKRIADRWIADFRDEVVPAFAWHKAWHARYLRGVRADADAICAASGGYLDVMGFGDVGTVIHNGFDTEDVNELAFPPKRADKLSFIHCGQMYGRQRDLSAFFRALAELIADGMVDPARVALVYAGRDTGGFVAQAQAAGLTDLLEGHDMLPRDASLALQKASHVLLLAAWNNAGQTGNIPGKFLEYLMLDMPVLCCVAGDVPQSEIAELMRRTGTGFCYEQANAPADYPRLKRHVLALYQAFAEGLPMPYAPDRAQVASFTSQRMAERFARIIDGGPRA